MPSSVMTFVRLGEVGSSVLYRILSLALYRIFFSGVANRRPRIHVISNRPSGLVQYRDMCELLLVDYGSLPESYLGRMQT